MGHGRARFESRYWGAHFMEFLHSRPDIVRSESQRSLLGRWNVARGAAALPAWQELHPDTLAVPRDNLSFLDVVAVNGGTRFSDQVSWCAHRGTLQQRELRREIS